MADGVQTQASEVLQSIARHINSLSENSKMTRRRALEGIQKETFGRKPELDNGVLEEVFSDTFKHLLKIVSDPVEKCRELGISLIREYFSFVQGSLGNLPYFMPVLVQRLGQQEIVEPSEEIRLQLVEICTLLVGKSKKKIAPYLDDMIKILIRTLMDPYPEVKKESCKCSIILAETIPEHFHMQSESLIKPLLQNIIHQHSKVRVSVIEAIGAVIQNGNNKSVEDVVSHFAQRMFDQSPQVRKAVTLVVGNWCLHLLDRYSFFPKLIPLLLTSVTDELPEIREMADSFWHDTGLKYYKENEEELKDKEDFAQPDPAHYPSGVERPNLGCRTLIYRHLSKILPALIRDMGDWVVATRIKSAQLMTTLIVNAEDCMTQHMAVLLPGLHKACSDEEKEVVKNVGRAAELVGYFVEPEVWCKLVLGAIKSSPGYGQLMVLANIIRGSQRELLKPKLEDICSVLSHPDTCRTVQTEVQSQLLSCVLSISQVCQEDCPPHGQQLFTVLVTVLALTNDDSIRSQMRAVLDILAKTHGLSSGQDLYSLYTKPLLDTFQDNYAMWNNFSVERAIFDALLVESGPVVGELLEDVIPIMVANLNPEKDPEIRLKFFSLLSRLMLNAAGTLDSQQRFGDFAVTVVKDMVIPNCVWKAGRIASAVRKTAVSCLWALLKSGVLPKEKVVTVMEEVLTQVVSTLDDDDKSTRLITCRVLMHLFNLLGTSIDQDRLHNISPELIKRLDDSSDDIRVAVSKTFLSMLDCFEKPYNVDLYRAHLEFMFKGLLVHLDDPEANIQEAVLEVLMKAASLQPAMLVKEIESVKHKHRTPKYCDALIEHIQTNLAVT
ncbi:dynein assembly factor 5, axonemal [Lingula anatina]|uniref:Dynein assembly factor 5, axonemal n=1 Tax=Lingula anatina TaxID=7574 RepID=A0A1S3J8R9_LINAN|nr:dynein assembly factor 5, axonemal [Lingula anatina]|eukprot:XP_013406264.1 dynein assembly factor 5, axonemal [Lingula anatina]